MEVILLDLFTLYHVITLEIEFITGCFIKFPEILQKWGNCVATGKFRRLA